MRAEAAEMLLDFWESFAKLHDTFGLPVDLIWLKLRELNCLPLNKQGEPMKSDEFEKGIRQSIAFLQCGGWRNVSDSIHRSISPQDFVQKIAEIKN